MDDGVFSPRCIILRNNYLENIHQINPVLENFNRSTLLDPFDTVKYSLFHTHVYMQALTRAFNCPDFSLLFSLYCNWNWRDHDEWFQSLLLHKVYNIWDVFKSRMSHHYNSALWSIVYSHPYCERNIHTVGFHMQSS